MLEMSLVALRRNVGAFLNNGIPEFKRQPLSSVGVTQIADETMTLEEIRKLRMETFHES